MNKLMIKAIASAIFLGAFAALAVMYLSGCAADDYVKVVSATGELARTGLSVRDQFEHPEFYRPHP